MQLFMTIFIGNYTLEFVTKIVPLLADVLKHVRTVDRLPLLVVSLHFLQCCIDLTRDIDLFSIHYICLLCTHADTVFKILLMLLDLHLYLLLIHATLQSLVILVDVQIGQHLTVSFAYGAIPECAEISFLSTFHR